VLCCLVIYDFTHANAIERQAPKLSSIWKAFSDYPFTWRRSLWYDISRRFIENCIEIESVTTVEAAADSIYLPQVE